MTLPSADWRLLITPPAPGAWNMAVDEAILESAGGGASIPTLRFYAWEPPCLSLGFAQSAADVDLDRLHERDWDLVRRPTGGRAILHTDELTYSVTGPLTEPRLAGSVLESYHRLAEALLAGLRSLGIPAEFNPLGLAAGNSLSNPVCFEMPSTYEITAGGKKLVGSAQARRKEGVLQHGSIPLEGDLRRITDVLVFPDESSRQEAAARLLERACTVEEVLRRTITWTEAAGAIRWAFSEVLNIKFVELPLTAEEVNLAEELMESKYAHESWTYLR